METWYDSLTLNQQSSSRHCHDNLSCCFTVKCMLFSPAFNSYLMDDVNGVFHSLLILCFFKEKKLCSNEQLCTYWKKSLFSSRRKGCGYSSWWITIKFDFVRVKPSMNCLFDPARLVIMVTINKLYLEWLMSGVVGMLWNGEGLGTGESNVSIVLLNSVLHRFSSLSDVHLATFTWNPV